jgi:hypothetical protein
VLERWRWGCVGGFVESVKDDASLTVTPLRHPMKTLIPLNCPCDSNLSRETFTTIRNAQTTLYNGYLGSRTDEERSEMRYVMRIARPRESSNL